MPGQELSSESEKQLKAYVDSFELFAKDCIQIKDHNTGMVLPLIFNRGQRILHQITEKQKKEKRHVRIILLKTRRFGGSTYVEGRFYWKTSLNFNRNTFITGHEEDSTATLYAMAQLMQERNPIAPSTRKSNAQELIFDTIKGRGLKSQYRLATAKNVDAGKSQGIHYLHLCMHKNSPVILADGSLKKAKSIIPGDRVITSSGSIAPVKKIFNTGIQRTYELKTWLSNEPIYLTAEHKVKTQNGYKKLKDLQRDDYIQIPDITLTNEIRTYQYNLKQSKKGNHHQTYAEIPLDYDFGYYIGYYLAEGSLKGNGKKPQSVNFTYHLDENFISKVHKFASEYAVSSKTAVYPKTHKKRTSYHGVFLANLTESIAGRASDKHIPEWFFKTNHVFVCGVLNGYIDGDGSKTYFDKNTTSIISICEKISRQIKRLIIAMGYGVPSLYFYSNRMRYDVRTKDVCNVCINGDTYRRYNDDDKTEHHILHKATKYKQINNKYYVKIRSITLFETAQTYDIEIDHPDHDFETTVGIISNSEESMYQGGGFDLLSGLLQCVPPISAEVDTEIFRESTAKGFGNSFQEDVFSTYSEGAYPFYEEDGIVYAWYSPKSDWILAFIPWFVHSWYSMSFDTEDHKKDLIEKIGTKKFNKDTLKWEDSEEKRLKDKFCLTLEQLNWRSWCIENQCRGSVDIFHQEYPSTVEEAFLSSGLNVFSKELCDEVEAECIPPILVGDIVDRMGKPKIRRNRHGHFKIWDQPEPFKDYIMTVDTAGGIKESQKLRKGEPDPSCIDVYERLSGKQVAQWHGHIDYDLLGDVVELVGNFYNQAIACVELQNHGYTVVADLKRKNYPMYEAKSGEPGWLTTKKTKPQMVDSLIQMCRDGQIQIVCKETVSEMRTFIEESGKFNASSGCHDERVDTAGMASVIMTMLPQANKAPKYNDFDYPFLTDTVDSVTGY
jgi:hypothetical protein